MYDYIEILYNGQSEGNVTCHPKKAKYRSIISVSVCESAINQSICKCIQIAIALSPACVVCVWSAFYRTDHRFLTVKCVQQM